DVLVGFAMALPGYRDGKPYLHSHMLAVLPEYRNGGLGRRLKLAQRDDALARGFDRMEWAFDPLEIKNAHLNLVRLGAIVRRYIRDFYGPSTSLLQGGLPTDRLVAEWWLRAARGARAKRWRRPPLLPIESSSESPFLTRSTTGNETRSSVSWLSNSKPVFALRSNPRSRAGWPSQATNAPRT